MTAAEILFAMAALVGAAALGALVGGAAILAGRAAERREYRQRIAREDAAAEQTRRLAVVRMRQRAEKLAEQTAGTPQTDSVELLREDRDR